jgi:hypothetical protein
MNIDIRELLHRRADFLADLYETAARVGHHIGVLPHAMTDREVRQTLEIIRGRLPTQEQRQAITDCVYELQHDAQHTAAYDRARRALTSLGRVAPAQSHSAAARPAAVCAGRQLVQCRRNVTLVS